MLSKRTIHGCLRSVNLDFQRLHRAFIHDVFLLREDRDGRVGQFLRGDDLAGCELPQTLLTESKSNLDCIIFQQTVLLVHLVTRLLARVHVEVLVGDDHLLLKGIDFTLALLRHLLYHVVARNEDGLEVGGV